MSNALVLGAGGVAGAFQAGALSVLLRKAEYAPAGIFGSSAGALNGAFLADRAGRASGQIDWASIGEELVNFWLNKITEPGQLWKERDDLDPGNWRGFYQTEAEKPGDPPLFWDIAREQIDPCNLKTAGDKGIHYTAGAVDLIEGDIRYPNINDPHIIDYILSSTAMPILFNSKDIMRDKALHSFVDGGTRDVAPVSAAVSHGYENISCIVCHPFKLKPVDTSFQPRNLEHLLPRIFSIVINETVNNDLLMIERIKPLLKENALEKQPASRREALLPYLQLKSSPLIRPSSNSRTEQINDFDFETKDIEAVIAEGISAAEEIFDKDLQFSSFTRGNAESPGGSFIINWDSSE